jgi:hypothetical protein
MRLMKTKKVPFLLVVGLSLIVNGLTIISNAQLILKIGLCNVENKDADGIEQGTAMVDYANTVPAPTTAAGGSGTIAVVCYTGPAFWLSVDTNSIGTNSVLLESTTNLFEPFRPYPFEGLQLTMTAQSPIVTNILPSEPARFFRAVVNTNY